MTTYRERLLAGVHSAEAEEGALGSLTKAQLVARAEAAGLDSTGTKAELLERLENESGSSS